MLNEKDEIAKERIVNIYPEDYDLLLSNSDFFDVGKEEGTYREKDLWKLIDKLSS